MALSNTEFRYYDSNVLRLTADKRKEYHEQVDRLIIELCKSIRDKTEIKITKVVKAGSFAKYTILRKTAVDPVDVDVVFYISGRDVDKETLDSLNNTIYELLIKQYPASRSRISRSSARRRRSHSWEPGSALTLFRSSRTRTALAMAGSSTSMTVRRSRPALHARSSSSGTARI